MRDGKKETWKEKVKINLSILVFCPTIYLATVKVYNKFEDWLIEAEKSVAENFGEKEKWTDKGNGKQQEADSFLHITTSHTQHLYQISKS